MHQKLNQHHYQSMSKHYSEGKLSQTRLVNYF